MTLLFLLFIAHRALSGLRNALIEREGANRLRDGLILFTCGMGALLCIALAQMAFLPLWNLPLWVLTVALVGSLLCSMALAVGQYFALPGIFSDVHLWTALEQAGFTALLLASGWNGALVAVLTVYPAVVMQKITLNLTLGLPWNYHGTDDHTGAYYGLPSLGLRVPRMPFWLRGVLALVSTELLILFSQL